MLELRILLSNQADDILKKISQKGHIGFCRDTREPCRENHAGNIVSLERCKNQSEGEETEGTSLCFHTVRDHVEMKQRVNWTSTQRSLSWAWGAKWSAQGHLASRSLSQASNPETLYACSIHLNKPDVRFQTSRFSNNFLLNTAVQNSAGHNGRSFKKHFKLFYIFWKECHDRDKNNIPTFCLSQHFAFPSAALNAPEIWLKQAVALSFFVELTLKSVGRLWIAVIFSWQAVQSWYFSLRHSAMLNI